MIYPQEIEVWYVLPALKRELCKELVSGERLSQKEIALKLGITEASVSQYLHSKRATRVQFSERFMEEIKQVCKKIVSGEMTSFGGIIFLTKRLRELGELCAVHRSVDDVPLDCEKHYSEICLKTNW